MIVINNVNGSTFSLNGTRYIKNFMIIKQGSTNVAIHNAYDTKYQLLSSTHYSQISVNNQVYTNQADLMASLAPVLFANSYIGGNVTSTSQLVNDGADGFNPFVTTADLPEANKIVNQTGYNLSGETLTINADWVWLIANQQYFNVAEVELTIPLAASGMTRIDLIVATSGSTFERITGVEEEDNAIAPPLPNNTIQATLIVVTDGIEPIVVEPTPTGDLYLQKADEKIATISSNGIISNFGLKNYTNYYIKETSSISQINGASFLASSISYDGKRIRFINKQSTPITFIHFGGTGTLKFDLVDGSDYVLKSNETISFIVKDGDKLLQIKESTSSAIPTLEQVTNAGNTTTNSIFIGDISNYIGLGTSYFETYFESGANYSSIYNGISSFRYETNDIFGFSRLQATPSLIRFKVQNSGATSVNEINIVNDEIMLLTSKLGIYGDTNKRAFLTTTGYSASGEYYFQFPEQSGTLALKSDLTGSTFGNSIPLSGTSSGATVTGDIEFEILTGLKRIDGDITKRVWFNDDGWIALNNYNNDNGDYGSVDVANGSIYLNVEAGNVFNSFSVEADAVYSRKPIKIYDEEYSDNGRIRMNDNQFIIDGAATTGMMNFGLGYYQHQNGNGRIGTIYFTNIDTTNKNYFLPNTSGTIALTSDISAETASTLSAIVKQTITNGITGSCPSQDAVYDAFALKADDNDVVHLTGNERIYGSKKFEQDVIFNQGINLLFDDNKFIDIYADGDILKGTVDSLPLFEFQRGSFEFTNTSNFNAKIQNFELTGSSRTYDLINVDGKLPVIGTIAPSASTATGTVGEIRITSAFTYTCIATNTWVRSAAATW